MMSEAALQNAFLNALFRHDESVQTELSSFNQGMAAYRNNGSANAARAMALMFPAVHALLGEEDFNPLAQLHWLAHPPQQGDWSQYGSDFGNWLATTNPGAVLDALPFLPDLARLDLALSRCQDAEDTTADLATLALLEHDPATLRMSLHPSVAVVDLAYDVIEFRHAVLAANALTEPIHSPCFAMLVRQNWRAHAIAMDAATAAFVRNCLAETTLLQAHDAATHLDANFDVSAWLTQAMATQAILKIVQTTL